MSEQVCITGKVSYGNKEADRVLAGMRKNRAIKTRPKRKYHCKDCNMWHITSKTKQDRK